MPPVLCVAWAGAATAVVQYEVDAVTAALNKALNTTVAKWSADGTLQPRSKENSRFTIDVHCDKGRRI